jgi:hypothetical protein
LKRSFQAFHGPIGRAIFDEQLGIEQSRLDVADWFFGIAVHTLRIGSMRAVGNFRWPKFSTTGSCVVAPV